MELEKLRAICRSLPGTKEDIKWGADLCFCVGEKMYVVTGLEGDGGFTLRAEPMEFERLISVEGVEPAPYLARHGWIRIEAQNGLGDERIGELIRTSYALVAAKLPRKVRDSLKKQ